MKSSFISPRRSNCARVGFVFLGTLTLLGTTLFPQTSNAATMDRMDKKSKNSKTNVATLQIWPGQRVLMVLPLTLGADWNESPELGNALLPLAKPELQKALVDTGKFSLTLPYVFDPILRRAVVERAISDTDVTGYVQEPSLTSAAPIVANLRFAQPTMATVVTLDELRIGGTQDAPTVQLKVSGRLYQSSPDQPDLGAPFRSISITSKPVGGKTPEGRVRGAAMEAFSELAAAFVEPPVSFSLPLPLGKNAMSPTTPAHPGDDNAMNGAMNPAMPPAPNPMMPAMPPSAGNSNPSIAPGLGLPAGTPPLGIDAPQQG